VRLGAYINARPPSGVGRLATARELAERARLLERTGYSSLWTGDQVFRGTEADDPLATLLVAASTTRSVELGTSILQVSLRNPVELAVRIQALANLSGHRLVLGAGSGSTREDFDALGVDFDTRFTLLEENLALMQTLWSGEAVHGARLRLEEDAPIGVPILIGTWGSGRWLERAAVSYDGWIASARPPRRSGPPREGGNAAGSWQELADGLARFRTAGGRRAVCANIHARLLERGEGESDRLDLVGEPAVIRDRLERLAALGFDDAVIHVNSWDEREIATIRELWSD
jgi:alkanesulfonate monooxygenase SsuD/methylene tetrahydromethanopterin reductase-like flavin-dependent oxidoreductase (luciferase family)